MSRRLVVTVATLAFLALALGAAPATLAGDPCYHDFDIPVRSEGSEPQIKLMPCAFAPTITRVPVGTTVEFFNGPGFVHLITGANQEWGSRDAEIKPGGKVSYTFDKAGIYPFACALHRGMSGAILVENASTAAAPFGGATGTAGAAAAAGTSTGQRPASAQTADVRGPVAVAVVAVASMLALAWAVARRRRIVPA
jgi:plastocyanin